MLIIIDGSSMLSSAYYATLPKGGAGEIMHTRDGVYTNGVLGMLRSIFKIIREQKPEYLAFAFDQTRNTFRREIYPAYKATRKETPEPLKQQFATMQHILEIFGFRIFCSGCYEADDYAASLAERFCGKVPETLLVTRDMDYLQLVDDARRIRVQLKKVYTEKELKEDYGLSEGRQVVEYKALVGDKSDNIPGVKGIGPKAAVPLLQKYGSVTALYQAVDAGTLNCRTLGIRKDVFRCLEKGRESAFLSLRLAETKRDIDLGVSLSDLRYCISQDPVREVIRSYELDSLKNVMGGK